MRVFVTGATGFIGSAVVKELLGAGHQVTGLARSANAAKRLLAAGAKPLRGSIEDLDVLRRGAEAADGAIHTAFFHELNQMSLGARLGVFLGGSPAAIPLRFVSTAVKVDRLAIETLGQALKGPDRPLVAAFGTMGLTPGQSTTEDEAFDPAAVGAMRSQTEVTMKSLAARGVRTSIIRLPPSVHGVGDHGFAWRLMDIARKKKVSAYIGDGHNRWPAVHRLDAARLFRLALEKGSAGSAYHAIGDEGVPFRDIAEVISRRQDVPLVSKAPAQANTHFSWLGLFVGIDNPATSALTQERLGWRPTQPDLLTDLRNPAYFT